MRYQRFLKDVIFLIIFRKFQNVLSSITNSPTEVNSIKTGIFKYKKVCVFEDACLLSSHEYVRTLYGTVHFFGQYERSHSLNRSLGIQRS